MSRRTSAELDLDLCWRVEEACLNAWPAVRTVMLGGWLARMSDGPTRRTDSVNPRQGSPDPTPIIEEAAALFADRGRAALFRIPSMATAAGAPLTRAGFAPPEGETCTLYAPTWTDRGAGAGEIDLNEAPGQDWLSARARFNDVDDAASAAYTRMLRLIVGPRRFAARRQNGRIVSIAYGVISRGLLVVESVATDPAERRTGQGRNTVGALVDWAASQGVGEACLQVVANNAPAHALYRSLGFSRELYRYHYRRRRTSP